MVFSIPPMLTCKSEKENMYHITLFQTNWWPRKTISFFAVLKRFFESDTKTSKVSRKVWLFCSPANMKYMNLTHMKTNLRNWQPWKGTKGHAGCFVGNAGGMQFKKLWYVLTNSNSLVNCLLRMLLFLISSYKEAVLTPCWNSPSGEIFLLGHCRKYSWGKVKG